MINATYEYRKGIFFVRIKEEGKKENINKIISSSGIKNIVINTVETNKYDNYIIDFIKKLSSNYGLYLVCSKENKDKYKKASKNLKIINDELEAFKIIGV